MGSWLRRWRWVDRGLLRLGLPECRDRRGTDGSSGGRRSNFQREGRGVGWQPRDAPASAAHATLGLRCSCCIPDCRRPWLRRWPVARRAEWNWGVLQHHKRCGTDFAGAGIPVRCRGALRPCNARSARQPLSLSLPRGHSWFASQMVPIGFWDYGCWLLLLCVRRRVSCDRDACVGRHCCTARRRVGRAYLSPDRCGARRGDRWRPWRMSIAICRGAVGHDAVGGAAAACSGPQWAAELVGRAEGTRRADGLLRQPHLTKAPAAELGS